MMYFVKVTVGLRVSKEGELEGLDLHEHGGGAYPELVGSSHGFSMPAEAQGSAARVPVPSPAAT
jgi:Amt family ammonium transporter